MKKILILLFLTSSAYADMDFICEFTIDETIKYEVFSEQIKEKDCVRNNILHLNFDFSDLYKEDALDQISDIANLFSSLWCRFDRNTTITYDANNVVTGLSCVLYSSSTRQIK
tara:strand:+ start:179 stop:517 length:339 start_codon:yes stop_codon:yes gene_type:complete